MLRISQRFAQRSQRKSIIIRELVGTVFSLLTFVIPQVYMVSVSKIGLLPFYLQTIVIRILHLNNTNTFVGKIADNNRIY